MVVGFMGASPFVQGLVFALFGVAFWVGGLLAANYLWKRWRNED